MSIGRKLFGLFDSGKRLYRFEEGEVDREQFEYCVQLMDLIFGARGYVDTLGPTWNMVHDPRFEAIENCFIKTKRTVFGGDPRVGTQTCLPDGTFISSSQDLEQYSEIISEGRYYHDVVAKEGIDPHTIKDLSDEDLWALIRRENKQQFSRKGEPNSNAKLYFKMLRADLLGLIADYAEVAKVQEWVLLEENGRLVEEADKKEYEENGDKPSVFLEIDLLEKALTFRSSLRVTAAIILSKLKIEESALEIAGGLTDDERDTLLKMVYGSKWPDERTKMYTDIVGWLASLKLQGSLEERQAQQDAKLSEESRTYIAGLKDGSILPITRYTEPVIEVVSSPEELAMEAILSNPLKQLVLLRVSDAEARIDGLKASIEIQKAELEQGGTEEERLDLSKDLQSSEKALAGLQKVTDLLLPVLEATFTLDDATFTDLMSQAEEIDSRLAKIITILEPDDAPPGPELLN